VKWIKFLAKNGYTEQALNLTQILLDISPRLKIKVDIWEYTQAIRDILSTLIKERNFLKFICSLLEKAVKFDKRNVSKNEDFSFIWRPAIEEHPQNIQEDVKNVLVDAVRDAAELLIKENLAGLEEIIAHLESYSYPIFRRIILYLLRRFSEEAQELISKYLTDYHLFSDPHFRHEIYPTITESLPIPFA